MKRVLIWIGGILGGLVLLLVLAIVFFVFLFDWNAARGPISERLSKMTGRQVAIDGDLHVDWGWVTRITLQKVSLGNPSWAKQKEMAAVDKAVIAIDMRQLLRFRLVLPEIALDRPMLDLEKPANGKPNWDLGLSPVTDTVKPDKRYDVPQIGHLIIRDGELAYRDEARRLDLNSHIATVEATGGNSNAGLHLAGKGTVEDKPFTIETNAGSLLALRETSQPYPMQVKIALGKTRVDANGTVTDPVKLEGVDLVLAVSGPNARELDPIFNLPLPSTPPYQLSGKLRREGNSWTWNDFDGRVGDSDLSGRLAVDTGGDRPRVTGDLRSKRIAASDLGVAIGVPKTAASGGQPDAEMSAEQKKVAARFAASDRVLPDAPLDLERVRKVDAKLKFHGDQVVLGQTVLGSVDMDLDLAGGVLKFSPLALDVAGGRVATFVTIDATGDPVRTDADIRLLKFNLAQAARKAGYPDAAKGIVNGRIKVKGAGDSIRRTLANADGQATILMGQGQFSHLAVELIGLDIARSLGLAIGGDENIGVRCMVGDWVLKDGVATSRALTLATNVSDIAGETRVNLKDETLAGEIKALPKQASLSARSPIEFGGTLRNPRVSPDVPKLAAQGAAAAALGVVLTPLASVLAFLDLGSSEAADCGALLKDAGRNDPAPAAGQPDVND
jgi:uncharacterized protein involved in outer membrane biogenesis